jgi:DNA repair exonuclease SbcCD ATPase subunit
MKFTHIKIKNFLTLKEVTARLDQRGLVLIQGQNRDDSSQDSNGAGKSSLADAVSWALFGVTARGESGNDVINNRVSRGGATVSLEIDDEGTYYRIERTRLKGKGSLEVERMDKGKWVSLTKGTTKLSQEAIDKLIGCSADVFANAIYSGQEKTPDLPGMTDKMLKMLIEEAAGINRLERAYKVARDRMNDTTKAISNKQIALDSGERLVQVRKNSIDRLIAAQDDWLTNHKLSLKSGVNSVKSLQKHMQREKDEFDRISEDKPKLQIELDEVNEKLSSMGKYQKAVREAEQTVTKLESDVRIKSRDLDSAEKLVQAVKNQYKDAGDIVGNPCDSCSKPYTAEDVEPRKKKLKAEFKTASQNVESVREQLEATKNKLSDALSKVKTAQAAVPDTTTELKRRDELSDALQAISNAERDAHNATQRVREEMERLKKLKTQVNPNDKLLEHERKLLTEAKKEYDGIKAEIDALEDNLKIKRAACQVFGPAGVRAHILDTVTPFLNDRTNHYLGALTDSNVNAVWSTIDTNAKGEIKEKFGIAVQSKVGAKTFKGLSGGEKRKARLACSMALQDLVSSRATKPIELYIADEIDHALDEAGLERLMGILEDKASDRGTVLVISHNSLSDWCSNCVTIVKEGGFSHLQGDALS